MGHYDDIREVEDARRAKESRQREFEKSYDELMGLLGMLGSPTPTVGNWLAMKYEAQRKAKELTQAVERANTIFQALMMHNEVFIAKKD